MSQQQNTDLIELASHHVDYWEGTLMAKLIEFDIERNDLESLEAHIKESAQLMFQNEYNPDEVAEKPNTGFNLEANDVY